MSIFLNHDHAQRWAESIDYTGKISKDGTVNPYYGASLYIVTSDAELYNRIKKHIHISYIDFVAMLESENVSSGERIMIALAGNLYNGGFFSDYTPSDIIKSCSTQYVEVACNAIKMATERISIDTVFE